MNAPLFTVELAVSQGRCLIVNRPLSNHSWYVSARPCGMTLIRDPAVMYGQCPVSLYNIRKCQCGNEKRDGDWESKAERAIFIYLLYVIVYRTSIAWFDRLTVLSMNEYGALGP